MPNKIRIISGKLRGSRLEVPDVLGLRPTPDRVRETLFNWLAPFIEGSNVLDLFAGTGALGIEAISRGAAHASFVEADRKVAELLKANLARLKIENAQVYTIAAKDFLTNELVGDVPPSPLALSRPREREKKQDSLNGRGRSEQYDIVFLDPPFAENLWQSTAELLEKQNLLKDNAWIYVESPAAITLDLPKNWELHREGRAGAVRFALYHREASLR